MITKQVTVSGTVGKQVFAVTNTKVVLKGFAVSPSGANATIKIRDGNASGDVVFFGRYLSAQGSKEHRFDDCGMRFDKGMHVKVIGANAEAYLYIN